MKLSIDHISPYQPYRINPLKVNYNGTVFTLEGISGGYNVSLRYGILVHENINVETIKPYLIPISDYKGMDWITTQMLLLALKDGTIPYKHMLEMFKQKVDCFGLIEQGLAIKY